MEDERQARRRQEHHQQFLIHFLPLPFRTGIAQPIQSRSQDQKTFSVFHRLAMRGRIVSGALSIRRKMDGHHHLLCKVDFRKIASTHFIHGFDTKAGLTTSGTSYLRSDQSVHPEVSKGERFTESID